MRRFLFTTALCLAASAALAQQVLVPSPAPGVPALPVNGNGATWYNAAAPQPTQVGAVQTAGTIMCLPVWAPVAQHWDRVSDWISTLGTTNLQIALYAGGVDGVTNRIQPQGAPLANSANIADTGTGVAVWTLGSPQAVGPGVVFICTANGDGSVIFLTTTNTMAAALIGTPTNSASFSLRGLSYAGSFGTWPNFTGVTLTDVIVANAIPVSAYRVSSVP